MSSKKQKVSAKRFVVDVSDLVSWHGNLSGIQRVVAEMAYRYEREGAMFCYYQESAQAFLRLDSFSELMERRKNPIMSAPIRETVATTRSNVKRAAKQLAPPLAFNAARRLKQGISDVRSKRHEVIYDVFPFEKGDALLVFGAHWDKPNYTNVLSLTKQQYGIEVAHLVHDMIPVADRAHVAHVEHERFPKYIREISQIADIIYVISDATKKDYIKFIKDNKIKSPTVSRLLLGENFTLTQPEKPDELSETQEYILMVGTVEVRKNHALLYSTYKRAHELDIDLPQLVVVGRHGWLSGDIYYQMIHDTDISHKITFIHDADDQKLSWLYSHCLFTVFPAYYEGWGLPVAEAAHYGKVSAASSMSSIPEVLGDGALYFSPYSSDDCLRAIQTLMDPEKRSKYEKIIQSRKPVSWDMTFEQTKAEF